MNHTRQILLAFLSALIFTITYTATAQNGALQFDGNNDGVTLGNVDYDLSTEITVMAWIKWNIDPETGNQRSNIVTCNTNTNVNNGRFWLQHNKTNHKFEFSIRTTEGKKSVRSRTNPVEGIWYHVAATYDGSDMRIYVNGILERSKNQSGDIVAHDNAFETCIGSSSASNNNYRRFNGEIDKVTIWNIALSDAELNDYACEEFAVTEVGLIALLDFNEEVGNDVFDLTGNGFDGVILDATRIANDNNSCEVLPVSLVDFSAKVDYNTVSISWNAASEINNDFFTVERSVDGVKFEEIGTVYGMGSTSIAQHYSFEDLKPLSGTAYYRLKQTDFDGTFEYFNTVNVSLAEKSIKKSYSIYPNPVILGSKINIVGLEENDKVAVYNMSGIECNIDHLEKGIYIVKINNSFSEKLIVK